LAAIEAFEVGQRLIDATKKAEPNVAPVIKADITVRVELLGAMRVVARENVEANLPRVSDPSVRGACRPDRRPRCHRTPDGRPFR
jgi:hypothetical protein